MATSGDDTLNGTPVGDVDGLEGNDTMIGGLGDDVYYVDSPGDSVVENPGEGIDTVYSSVTYALPDDVERLVLTGTADIDGYGNASPNELYGNAGRNSLYGFDAGDILSGGAGDDQLDSDGGADFLYGGDGNDFLSSGEADDWLDGGTGDDNLMGGSGNDTYVFGAGYGHDVATDFGGTDSVQLVGGLTPADVAVQQDGSDLLVVVRATGDSLRLDNWFVPGMAVESIAFQGTPTVVDASGVQAALANSAPVAMDDSAAVAADGAPAMGNVLGNDIDPDAGNVLAVTNPGTYQGAYGTLVLGADGKYTYTLDSSLPAVQALAKGETLSESFGYTTTDGVALNPLSDSAQLGVTINGANDDPVAANAMADQRARAGEAFSFALPAGAFTDVDHGDRLALSAKLSDGSALPTWLTFNAGTGAFTGTAPGTAGGTTLSVQVTATDLAGAQASDVFAFALDPAAPPPDLPHDPPPVGLPHDPPPSTPNGRHIVGTRHKDRLVGTNGDDLIEGRNGNDRLRGKRGVDILQGGKGNDELIDRSGNTVFDGGRGNDSLTGGRDDDFFAGGRGNDRLQLGGGNDVVAFNRGDGVDRLFGERQDGVLSLGGGIRYEDLRLSKHGSDLVLKTGHGDQIVLEDWYRGKQSILTLQVVAEAMAGFSQGSHDPLRDDKVETFDFRKLVAAYDSSRAAHHHMRSWNMMNELLAAHLGGSDSAALGGDLAYRYGMTGSLAGMGWGAARDTVAAQDFGSHMQALKPVAEVNAGPVKLG